MAKPSVESVHKEVQMLREEVDLLKSIMNENLDGTAKKRLAQIRRNPEIGKEEGELNTYLKKRGVRRG